MRLMGGSPPSAVWARWWLQVCSHTWQGVGAAVLVAGGGPRVDPFVAHVRLKRSALPSVLGSIAAGEAAVGAQVVPGLLPGTAGFVGWLFWLKASCGHRRAR